jgi:hypothetical protein
MNIWVHVSDLCPGIFVDDVSPTNVTPYIRRCHVTDKYIVKFVGTDE